MSSLCPQPWFFSSSALSVRAESMVSLEVSAGQLCSELLILRLPSGVVTPCGRSSACDVAVSSRVGWLPGSHGSGGKGIVVARPML